MGCGKAGCCRPTLDVVPASATFCASFSELISFLHCGNRKQRKGYSVYTRLPEECRPFSANARTELSVNSCWRHGIFLAATPPTRSLLPHPFYRRHAHFPPFPVYLFLSTTLLSHSPPPPPFNATPPRHAFSSVATPRHSFLSPSSVHSGLQQLVFGGCCIGCETRRN